jgi:hypothetical protein
MVTTSVLGAMTTSGIQGAQNGALAATELNWVQTEVPRVTVMLAVVAPISESTTTYQTPAVAPAASVMYAEHCCGALQVTVAKVLQSC